MAELAFDMDTDGVSTRRTWRHGRARLDKWKRHDASDHSSGEQVDRAGTEHLAITQGALKVINACGAGRV